ALAILVRLERMKQIAFILAGKRRECGCCRHPVLAVAGGTHLHLLLHPLLVVLWRGFVGGHCRTSKQRQRRNKNNCKNTLHDHVLGAKTAHDCGCDRNAAMSLMSCLLRLEACACMVGFLRLPEAYSVNALT